MRFSLNIAILVLGVFCCSTSVIFIKATAQPALIIAAWRLVVASLLLFPLFLRAQRSAPEIPIRARFRMACVPGTCRQPCGTVQPICGLGLGFAGIAVGVGSTRGGSFGA